MPSVDQHNCSSKCVIALIVSKLVIEFRPLERIKYQYSLQRLLLLNTTTEYYTALLLNTYIKHLHYRLVSKRSLTSSTWQGVSLPPSTHTVSYNSFIIVTVFWAQLQPKIFIDRKWKFESKKMIYFQCSYMWEFYGRKLHLMTQITTAINGTLQNSRTHCRI